MQRILNLLTRSEQPADLKYSVLPGEESKAVIQHSAAAQVQEIKLSEPRTLEIATPKFVTPAKSKKNHLKTITRFQPVMDTINDLLDGKDKIAAMKACRDLHDALNAFPLTIYQVASFFKMNTNSMTTTALTANRKKLDSLGEDAFESLKYLGAARPELCIDSIIDLTAAQLINLYKHISSLEKNASCTDGCKIDLAACTDKNGSVADVAFASIVCCLIASSVASASTISVSLLCWKIAECICCCPSPCEAGTACTLTASGLSCTQYSAQAGAELGCIFATLLQCVDVTKKYDNSKVHIERAGKFLLSAIAHKFLEEAVVKTQKMKIHEAEFVVPSPLA